MEGGRKGMCVLSRRVPPPGAEYQTGDAIWVKTNGRLEEGRKYRRVGWRMREGGRKV